MIRTSGFKPAPSSAEHPSAQTVPLKPPGLEVKVEQRSFHIPRQEEIEPPILVKKYYEPTELLGQAEQDEYVPMPYPEQLPEPISAQEPLTGSQAHKKSSMRLFYGLMIIFLMGMLYGAAFSSQGEQGLLRALALVRDVDLLQNESSGMLQMFLSSLASSGIFLGVLFLSGLCMVGQPVAWLTPFVRGLGIGSYMGYLYLEYGRQGILYSSLLILPSVLLTTMVVVLASREAIRLSNRTFLSFIKESQPAQKKLLIRYIQKFVILLLLLAVAALVDIALRFNFSDVISLA